MMIFDCGLSGTEEEGGGREADIEVAEASEKAL